MIATKSVEDVVPMRRCLEMEDLDELLVATEGKIFTVTEATSKGAAIAADDSEDQSGDEASEKGGVKICIGKYVRLSNEHVCAMIISYLGPEEVTASGEIFDKIKMKRDAMPFANRSHASSFLREWKNADKWCSLLLPKNK